MNLLEEPCLISRQFLFVMTLWGLGKRFLLSQCEVQVKDELVKHEESMISSSSFET